MSHPETDPSLRGDLVKKESKLRGSLTEGSPAEETSNTAQPDTGKLRMSPEIQRAMDREKRSEDLAIGDHLHRRDNGNTYVVEAINENPYGKIVLLRGPEGDSISLRLDDLQHKIATPGEAWERK